jgi:2-C-methyl-D-erythritol 4-phosphate cytidylyltransferase
MNLIDERKVSVIIPILNERPFGTLNKRSSLCGQNSANQLNSVQIDFESSIESTCFSKPLIVFLIKSLKRIACIDTIFLCSASSRQEQVQALVSEHINEYEGLKYLFIPHVISHSTSNSISSSSISGHSQHEISLNRMLKYCFTHLNEYNNDNVIVIDPCMPCINEELINNLCIESFKHGVACLSTLNSESLLAKLDESNIEEEELQTTLVNNNLSNRSAMISSRSISGALVSDYFDSNYRLCYKPQAFKYSIFRIIIENVSVFVLYLLHFENLIFHLKKHININKQVNQ